MKIKLLLLLLLSLNNLHAQKLYRSGVTTKGEKASYYCYEENDLVVGVRNVKNVDTNSIMYYKNGQIVPNEEAGGGSTKFNKEDLLQAFKEILTPTEWNTLKGKLGYFIVMKIVANNNGDTQEISFQFRRNDPVMATFNPDRLYQFEEKLKKIIKIEPTENDRQIRNIKYIYSFGYRDMN